MRFALAILQYEDNLRAEQQHSDNCWGSHGCCSNNLELTTQVLLLKMLSHKGNQHLCSGNCWGTRGRLAGDAADEEPRMKKEKYGKIDREERMQTLPF